MIMISALLAIVSLVLRLILAATASPWFAIGFLTVPYALLITNRAFSESDRQDQEHAQARRVRHKLEAETLTDKYVEKLTRMYDAERAARFSIAVEEADNKDEVETFYLIFVAPPVEAPAV
jgi:hypothetical protein